MSKLRDTVEHVAWMMPADYEILQFFRSHNITISAADLSKNIDFNSEYIGKRLRALRDAGLFEQEGRAYRLSELGEQFVEGDAGADDLVHPGRD